MQIVGHWLSAFWQISLEAAPFLVVGFTIAALLLRYVPARFIVRMLGTGKIRATATAAAVGIPLPLCSCSVIPTALALRKKGASKGATLAFLISTPETGVDSILITYGLLGPILAVVRPVAAAVSALGAGLALEVFSPSESPGPQMQSAEGLPKPPNDAASCCHAETIDLPEEKPRSLTQSFLMVFDDVASWLLIGLILSAIVAVSIPDDWMPSGFIDGWGSYAAAIAIGIPMYVCASASTPLAAVLMAKGMLSAGSALVFLLVGPATNLGTIGIVGKILGKRAVVVYLSMIAGVALLFGLFLDWAAPGIEPVAGLVTGKSDATSNPYRIGITVVFLALLGWRLVKKGYPGIAGKRSISRSASR